MTTKRKSQAHMTYHSGAVSEIVLGLPSVVKMLIQAIKTSKLERNVEYFDEKRCVTGAEADKLRAKLYRK